MTQTLDELLTELKEIHGDAWPVWATHRWVDIEIDEDNTLTDLEVRDELGAWVYAMVAAGVAATEKKAAWEPVRSLWYEEEVTGRVMSVDKDGALIGISKPNQVARLIRLPPHLRLCRLVQRPAAGGE